MKLKILLSLLSFLSISVCALEAQTNDEMTKDYIAKYAPLAIEQQALYGIPASITLAQGIVESAFGTSHLAIEHNNHFGIKCGGTWSGRSTGKIDDDKDAKGRLTESCFRSYRTDKESFTDHSLFLCERDRYKGLFELDVHDYKGWARGLKAAGYATNPKYADMLIDKIEEYELYRYDRMTVAQFKRDKRKESSSGSSAVNGTALAAETPKPSASEPQVEQNVIRTVDIDRFGVSLNAASGYGIYSEGGARYVVARSSDSIEDISKATGVAARRLRRYNALSKEAVLFEGERIFLESR